MSKNEAISIVLFSVVTGSLIGLGLGSWLVAIMASLLLIGLTGLYVLIDNNVGR